MAVVYRAEDFKLHREVAPKFLPDETTRLPDERPQGGTRRLSQEDPGGRRRLVRARPEQFADYHARHWHQRNLRAGLGSTLNPGLRPEDPTCLL